mgnify:CR=1 FL=1
MADVVGTYLATDTTGKHIPIRFVDLGNGEYGIAVGGGNVASGATDSGNPLKVGGVYRATKPVLTDGQRGDLQVNTSSVLLATIRGVGASGLETETAQLNTDTNNVASVGVKAQAHSYVYDASAATWARQSGNTVAASVLPGLTTSFWNYAAAASGIVNTTTAVTVKAAAGASVRNYISSIDIEWDTLGAATEFAIRDGAAGTVIYRTKLNTAAGRKTVNFPVPLRGTANTLVEVVTLTASVTGGVFVNLQGFTGA